MQYIKYQPHILLQNTVESYWVLHTDSSRLDIPLFADASTTIFINLGNNNELIGDIMPVISGHLYLGGPARAAHFFNCFPGNVFVGIRFKPGGIPHFYHLPMAEMTDKVTEFHDMELSCLLDTDELLPLRLDTYFLSKQKKTYANFNIPELVYRYKGQISVDQLAKHGNVSNRSLERYCYNYMGIGPKEFINIVRFKEVMHKLKNENMARKCLDLATEMGYYDQSHFIKEIKKRSGSTPSAIGSVINMRSL